MLMMQLKMQVLYQSSPYRRNGILKFKANDPYVGRLRPRDARHQHKGEDEMKECSQRIFKSCMLNELTKLRATNLD